MQGFTLIEAVVVIVITAIIGAVVAVFMRTPVEGYADSAARAELTDAADVALRRIARDIRLALPNSVRVTQVNANTVFLEMFPTTYGGRYLAVDDPAPGIPLQFGNEDAKSFQVVGAMPPALFPIIPGVHSVVVYNLDALNPASPVNAYNANSNRARVTAVNGNTITLDANPFTIASPSHRFQVVTTPVTYVCQAGANGGGRLNRFWNYGIQAVQPATVAQLNNLGATSALVTDNVLACSFTSNTLANQNAALVTLTLGLQVPGGRSGVVTLSHQVHVDNTP